MSARRVRAGDPEVIHPFDIGPNASFPNRRAAMRGIGKGEHSDFAFTSSGNRAAIRGAAYSVHGRGNVMVQTIRRSHWASDGPLGVLRVWRIG